MTLLLLLLGLVLAKADCYNNCSGFLCVNNSCQCPIGSLQTDCSLPAANSVCQPGEIFCQAWSVVGDTIYMQLYVNTSGWAGVILYPDDDGMLNGDCWIVGVDGSGEVFAQDRYSYGYEEPSFDEPQDLTNVVGYRSQDGLLIVSFQRLLDTGDALDDVIIPGLLPMAYAWEDDSVSVDYHGPYTRAGTYLDWIPTPPGIVARARVLESTADSLLVDWEEPGYSGSQPISSYTLQIAPSTDPNSFVTVFEGLAFNASIGQLQADSQYTLRVRANNPVGAGPYLSWDATTTPSGQPVPPAKPYGPYLDRARYTSLSLSWLADLHGYPIVGYYLRVAPSGEPLVLVYNGTDTSFTVSGLTLNTNYSITVQAETSAGLGESSDVVTFTTLSRFECSSDDDCSNHGACVNTSCQCAVGWLDQDCSINSMATFCSSGDSTHCHSWSYDSERILLQLVVQTTGWAGLIINPDDGAMANGDCWIVWVEEDDGQAYVSDRFSYWYYEPDDGEPQNLVNVTGYQNGNTTIVNFARLLDTEDPLDYLLGPGQQTLAWAYGLNDVIAEGHEINTCGETSIVWLVVVPGAPAAPVAVNTASDFITVKWSAPSDTGGLPITSYLLEISSTPGVYENVFEGLATQATASGLLPSSSYTFRLSANNSLGRGASSGEVVINTVGTGAIAPDQPQPPQVVTQSNTFIELSWETPDLHGFTLLNYLLEYKEALASEWLVGYEGAEQMATVAPLLMDHSYSFRLTATSEGGVSPTSDIVNYDTASCSVDADCGVGKTCLAGQCVCAIGYLLPDCSLKAFYQESFSGGRFLLAWAFDNTSIYVQLAAATPGWVGLIFNETAGTGMDNGDCWVVDVDDSTGEVSALDGFSYGDAPQPTFNERQDLTNWSGYQTAGGFTVVSFQRLIDTGDSEDRVATLDGQWHSWAFGSSDQFAYHDSNRDAICCIQWLLPFGPPAQPDPPVAVRASNVSILLQWSSASFNGSSDIINYLLQRDDGAGGSFQDVVQDLIFSYEVTGLSPLTTYQFRLQAFNSEQPSAFSSVVSVTTLSNDYRVPATPASPALAHAGSSSLELTFGEVETYGAPLLSYTLQISPDTNPPSFANAYQGLEQDVTITLLNASSTYLFRLKATSLVGDSDWSAIVSYATVNCPNDCSGFGQCLQGVCVCDAEHVGADCAVANATTSCFDGGYWCMKFKVQEPAIYVSMQLRYPPVAWSGFMFGASDGMTNGDTWVVTYDPASGQVTATDYWSTGFDFPNPSQSTLQDVTGYALNGVTVVNFWRLLDTKAPKHLVITPGTTPCSWAFGESIVFDYHFDNRGRATIDFFTGETVDLEEELSLGAYLPIFVALLVILVGGYVLNLNACTKNSLGGWLNFSRVSTPGKRHAADVLTCDVRLALLDLSWAELLVVVVYLAGAIFTVLLVNNHFEGGADSWAYSLGHLTAMHIAITMIPPLRNSVVLYVMGVPFERTIKFHRWVARVALLVLVLHGALFIKSRGWDILWSSDPTADGEGVLYGFLAFLCFGLMGVFALEPFRRLTFELFYYTHFLFIVGVVFAWLHSERFRYFMIPAIALYALDRLVRFVWSRRNVTVMSSRVLANGEGQVTEIIVRVPGMHFRPGDYCFVNVPAISELEWHPFSISNGPNNKEEVRFHVMNMGKGTWTGKLAKLVSDADSDIPIAKIRVDGPYGRIALPVDSYQVIVMVAGGVGITPMMSLLEDLHAKQTRGELNSVHSVHLIWANRHHHAFTEWFPEKLKELIAQEQSRFYLHLYWTDRKSRPSNQLAVPVSAKSIQDKRRPLLFTRQDLGSIEHKSLLSDSSASDNPELAGVQELAIERAHRPDYATLFDAFKRDAEDPSRVAVLACGPQEMIDAAQTAALERSLHFHKEIFFL